MNGIQKAKSVLSFGSKLSKHWFILVGAAFFDLLGMIPGIAIIFNFIFGLTLLLYFGPKSNGGSELAKIGLPIMLGSVIDFFVGILPVNLGAAFIRIALS